MHSLDKLKRLKDEVNRLFHEGLDEMAVIDQLRTVEQFSGISYEQVQAFYSKLQEKSNAEAEREQKIVENERQILELQQKIVKRQQKNAKYERVLGKEQQMKAEIEFMDKHRQNSNKFMIYDENSVSSVFCNIFWQGRFLIFVEKGNETDDLRTIKVQDLFQGVAKSFTIPKIGDLCSIYALKFPFVLFCQFNNSNRVSYLYLLKFDFENESLQVVQSLEFDGICYVLVNTSDTSKFLLKRRDAVNECNLVGDQIRIGRKLALGPDLKIYRGSYFDGHLCVLRFEVSRDNQFGNIQLTQVKVSFCDLEQNKHSAKDIDSTPENINCLNPNLLRKYA